MSKEVPPRYQGVWQRTLLETPTERDDTTFVRWMQTTRWHADLRVPTTLPREAAQQQGFAGTTEVVMNDQGEICHWHRDIDLQPPGPHPDAGSMVFETPDRVIETGVHGIYREVWQRLPASTGRCLALGRSDRGGRFQERLLMAGCYLMRVRAAAALRSDIEISFGRLDGDRWQIERSTLPDLERQTLNFSVERTSNERALVQTDAGTDEWAVVA